MRSSISSDTRRATVRPTDRGQAAVEFAIAVPIVVVLVLGIVQVLVIGLRQAAIEDLARDAARAASVAADPSGAARDHVARRGDLGVLDVGVTATSSTVTVTLRYDDPTSVPVIGSVIGPVELTASSTMPREPP